MRIHYRDEKNEFGIYTVVNAIRKTESEIHAFFSFTKLGETNDKEVEGRGELISLYSVNPKNRSEIFIVSPDSSEISNKSLADIRSKFQNISYCGEDPFMEGLHKMEMVQLPQEGSEMASHKFVAKISFEVKSEFDSNFDLEKKIFAVTCPSGKIYALRVVRSKEHLQGIFDLARKYHCNVLCSDFTKNGDKFVSKDNWSIVPEDFEVLIKKQENDEDSVDIKNEPEKTPILNPDTDGFECPYCGRQFKKKFGLTNHVKGKHPDMLDDYRS